MPVPADAHRQYRLSPQRSGASTAAPGTPTGGRHARPDAPDHTERASTNSDDDGHER